MSYVFGPVPSQRLGRSLGIDPVPLKTCNFSCLYCQLGRTQPLVNLRREYTPPREVLRQVEYALERLGSDGVDWLTFVGSGEPTLHCDLGWLIRRVKALSPLPVAVITNGTLLYIPAVRHAVQTADAVLPSLDAGSPGLFRRIARPHPTCTFDRLTDGLITFRREYTGKLWLEVMLVGRVNDSESALNDIASAARLIEPDEIRIGVPTRPPAETWVCRPDEEALMRAATILGRVTRVVYPSGGELSAGVETDDPDALIDIITRHPMREDELERCFPTWPPGGVRAVLTDLKSAGEAQMVERHGLRFWAAKAAQYPDQDECTSSSASC